VLFFNRYVTILIGLCFQQPYYFVVKYILKLHFCTFFWMAKFCQTLKSRSCSFF
jgi:hypothetical protein